MLLEIDYHSGLPIYRQIIRQIRRQIMTDQLVQGDQLEPVRELAARIKVNPMTISKAYALLENEGLLERKRGIGLFVAKVKKGHLNTIKAELFDDIISKAAVTAIQLGLSQAEAIEFFKKHYNEYKTETGGKK